MAVFLLAKSQDSGFRKVLDSTAKYDSNELVREMAVALGGRVSQEQTRPAPPTPEESAGETAEQPTLDDLTQQPASY